MSLVDAATQTHKVLILCTHYLLWDTQKKESSAYKELPTSKLGWNTEPTRAETQEFFTEFSPFDLYVYTCLISQKSKPMPTCPCWAQQIAT